MSNAVGAPMLDDSASARAADRQAQAWVEQQEALHSSSLIQHYSTPGGLAHVHGIPETDEEYYEDEREESKVALGNGGAGVSGGGGAAKSHQVVPMMNKTPYPATPLPRSNNTNNSTKNAADRATAAMNTNKMTMVQAKDDPSTLVTGGAFSKSRRHFAVEEKGTGGGGGRGVGEQGGGEAGMRRRRCVTVIDPRDNSFMARWDVLMLVLLMYTALVTPYEVAFLETQFNFLFVLNRCVDTLFIIDMGINFCLGYVDPVRNVWVFEQSRIVRKYALGWFSIDFVSCLPFDLVGMFLPSEGMNLSQLKLLRVVRLFRLIKLLRILRSGRIVQRIQSTTGLSFSMYALSKMLVGVLIVVHWLACMWGIIRHFPDSGT